MYSFRHSEIYANNGWVSSFDLYALTVGASGVVQANDYQNGFSEFYITIHYDAGTGLVYGDDGTVVNPTNGHPVGSFQASGLMIPDSALNTAFFLGQTQAQIGTTDFTIESFDMTTFAPIAEVPITGIQGIPLHFIQWGANAFAFNDDAGFVYILDSPFPTANGASVATPSRFLNPVRKPRAIPKTLRVSNVMTLAPAKHDLKRKSEVSESATPNPSPIISALSPSTVALGAVGPSGFTLTVTGSNFVSLSTVDWNGSQVPTEFVSSTELQAQIANSALANAGSIPVSVVTPSPGGGSSSVLPFTVVAELPTPAPVIVSLDPNSAPAGSSGFTLNVNGLSNFTSSSVVFWNGIERPSTVYSPGQLQVQVNASDLATPGYAQITVVNPGPGGGTSNTAEFQVLYQPTIVNQETNDMVWDPLNKVIYISVPGSASAHANQVCILNPATASIGSCQAAGSEPDVLAISDDSQFLYVGQDGSGTVQRYLLPALTPDISYSLGDYATGVPYYALDLQVAPGAPHTTAVTKGTADVIPMAQGGITILDDSIPRPVSAPGGASALGMLYDTLQWGADATKLYASNTETTNDFYMLTVSSSGVVLDQDIENMFWNPGRIHFDSGNGFIYSDDGFHAINPAIGLPAGIFEIGGGWPMAPDSSLNTVFILSQYVFQENSNYTINLFDPTRYLPLREVPFSTTQGIASLGRFIRWASNGLAVNDTAGNIYLLSGSFVSASHRSRTQVHPRSR